MAIDLDNFKTLMGWNQVVELTDGNNSPLGGNYVLRVANYQIGVEQTGDAPDYVTGQQDRTAWTKGPIISQGTLEFPYTFTVGAAVFDAAVNLSRYPDSTFTVASSAHPQLGGCKVNTSTLSCDSGGPVSANAEIWGVVNVTELETVNSYGDDERITWGGSSDTLGASEGGDPLGADVSGTITLEQIPQWDVCSVQGAPTGMFVVGFSINIDNRLQRNYTMGDGDGTPYSPWGLNPTSISTNQRLVGGTITWQSEETGYISEVIGVGIEELIIDIGPLRYTLSNCMWNATPPTLATGDRVTVESSFTALGTGTGSGVDAFDAIVKSDSGFTS